MSVLSGKKILLGISGGIAAYKTTYLTRLLIKSGAEVKIVMTPASKDFVTTLTLSTLSKNPVHSAFFDSENENELWNNHVDLALWADYMLIAPATANTLSKMANGTSDNLLLACYLSAKCKVYFAPAMDLDMYKHPSTKNSLTTLQDFGNVMIPATSGELASGLIGEGRMAEPEDIIRFIEKDILSQLPLKNKTVLITAGPTYQDIDPVRFIGNRSTGKMGFALAHQAANLGANVILISGPSAEKVQHSFIKRIDVRSAEDMYQAVHQYYKKAAIVIASAAVADFTPAKINTQKIKKKDGKMQIELVATKDILASLGKEKEKQILVGFALETNNELENAIGKLERKNLDLIVLNSLQDKGAGFANNTNKITLIDRNKKHKEFPLKSKQEVAKDIFSSVLELL
ncbi:MAG TPA: bifunctional phosphopantothenoylcysteine decarboxylase/phosphopantothenate--cysteine ligase CoaBC [Flavobacteriia bacterium]|nr:bifunctional phosphopantothenoylcysteine decarboxylase/phosphopantothenate--cysteine ligase CoaBC [Flavobacteriia bacterium]